MDYKQVDTLAAIFTRIADALESISDTLACIEDTLDDLKLERHE